LLIARAAAEVHLTEK